MTEDVSVALRGKQKRHGYNHGENGVTDVTSGSRNENTNSRHY